MLIAITLASLMKLRLDACFSLLHSEALTKKNEEMKERLAISFNTKKRHSTLYLKLQACRAVFIEKNSLLPDGVILNETQRVSKALPNRTITILAMFAPLTS